MERSLGRRKLGAQRLQSTGNKRELESFRFHLTLKRDELLLNRYLDSVCDGACRAFSFGHSGQTRYTDRDGRPTLPISPPLLVAA